MRRRSSKKPSSPRIAFLQRLPLKLLLLKMLKLQ
jgi:hypothetical protein